MQNTDLLQTAYAVDLINDSNDFLNIKPIA